MVVLFICGAVAMWHAGILRKGVFQASLNVNIFGWREVESYKLMQMCRISGAMNECISASLCLSMCPWVLVLESSAQLKLQFILVLLMLGDYNFYGRFLEGMLPVLIKLGQNICFIQIFLKIRFFFIVSYLGLCQCIL